MGKCYDDIRYTKYTAFLTKYVLMYMFLVDCLYEKYRHEHMGLFNTLIKSLGLKCD